MAARLVRIGAFILVLFWFADSTGNQPMNVAVILAVPNTVDDVLYITHKCLEQARKLRLRS